MSSAEVAAIIERHVDAARAVLRGRRVLLGVTGGIAAYKGAEVVRLLVRAGAEVRVVMTKGATEFIAPLTLQSLAGKPVVTSLWDLHAEATIGHIEVADWAELFVVAPATADVLAKLAHGLADDVLTTIALACKAPLLVAPAMNVNMWAHAATRANVETLMARGVKTVGPGAGDLACGWVGDGRMAEPLDVLDACVRAFGTGALRGKRVLVTAGPTHEPIDPVRFIGNRSTGKMGFAVAAEAAARGAEVVLVAGPTGLETPRGVTRVDVVTAAEMHAAVLRNVEVDVIVMTAAVADERPAEVAPQKLKKRGEHTTLALEPTIDILAELGTRSPRPVLVGFAAETENVLANARGKLEKKRVDLVIANDVSTGDAGFGVDDNRVVIVSSRGEVALPLLSKAEVARHIWDAIAEVNRG